jgi:serine/threonine protein kinase
VNPTEEPFRLREIWPPGTVIKGDYSIQRRLGSGGFGTVYLAQHRFFSTTHVIKRLHEQYASDPEYVRKFVNEARAVRRLKGCLNVVEVEHMTQSEDGHLILVMEHITGGDLFGLMASRMLSVAEVIDYARQIASGLEAAHASGLVHRDIKPENVMISRDRAGKTVLKLIDFGIAADHLSHQQTSVMRGGSVGYAAPEQWMKAGKELDGRTDLYALGASMYRMLCGRMPYDANDVGDWLDKVRQGPPVPPAQVRRDVSGPLSNLILEMLAVSPDARPANAAAVIRRLDGLHAKATILEDKPWEHPPQTPKPGWQGGVTPPIIDPRTHQPRRSKWPLWTGAFAFAAVLSFAGWFVIGNKPPEPEQTGKAEPATTTAQHEPPSSAPAPSVPKQVDPPKPQAKQEEVPQNREPRPQEKQPETTTQPGKIEPPKPEPAIDHAALGDAAMNAGDLRTALTHYRTLGDPARLAKLQRAVESDADERATVLLDKGQYPEALRLVDGWSKEFPSSQRLQALRAKIVRAKEVQ